MRCWIHGKGSHGSQNLENAIKHSCNAFFFQFGNAAGIDQINFVGHLLGLGETSDIPLSGESPGILPGPDYLARVRPRERWTSGYTANTSIGQGEVLASPLQMAMMTAAVANGGTTYFPRMVDRVVSQDGQILLQEPARVRSNLVTDAGLTPAQIEHVRKGMWKVVNEAGGTGGRARIKGIEVAGKTGTAQNMTKRGGRTVKDNHVWFTCFAPYENPRYAVVVFVQGAKSGGGVAAPIASKILDDIFKIEAGESYQLAWLDPEKGNFNFVESVDYGRPIPAATALADDGEVAPASARTAAAGDTARPAAPNVRADADEGGRVKNRDRQRSGLEKFFGSIFGGNKEKKEKPRPTPSGGRR